MRQDCGEHKSKQMNAAFRSKSVFSLPWIIPAIYHDFGHAYCSLLFSKKHTYKLHLLVALSVQFYSINN